MMRELSWEWKDLYYNEGSVAMHCRGIELHGGYMLRQRLGVRLFQYHI